MQVPNRTSPSAPASFPNSRSSIRAAIEIYRCCSDTLDAGFDLTAEQEKCIRGIQEQIAIAAPDALDRIREQEQHLMEPYNQEPIM